MAELTNNTTNKTDAVVLAEKVLQTSMARSLYLKHMKSPPDVRKRYLDDLRRFEQEEDTYAYAVLNPLPSQQRTYANKRY